MNDRIDFTNLVEKFYKMTSVVSQEMKTARDYGVGFLLYHSEVQLLDIIDNHEGANASELAKLVGITSGAIGQVSKKLLNKRLIETYRLPNNKKEVYFKLTDLGRKASEGHRKHHETINLGIYEYLSRLDKNDLQKFSELLDVVINEMQDI